VSRRLISTGSPFEKQAGYSRAVVDGDWVFVSGTTGYDYATMTMPADPGTQARNALATIARALEEAGCSMADVVRARYYVTERAHAARFSRRPARCSATSGPPPRSSSAISWKRKCWWKSRSRHGAMRATPLQDRRLRLALSLGSMRSGR
jgi:enamine deaminase RidA (YjgF/YER057c/UK114 family)